MILKIKIGDRKMRELLQFVPKKDTAGKKVLNIISFILACLCIFSATFINPIIFAIPSVAFTLLWFFLQFRSKTEYEYIYFDGEFRVAKIRNKAKRKRIALVNMDDVIIIAPKGDRSVYKYENDNQMPHKNFTSGDATAKVYIMVVKSESNITRYEIEPEEEFIDTMKMKYPRVVEK